MKTERSDVEFPLWRKKVDASLLNGVTPIPKWVCKMWALPTLFKDNSAKAQKQEVQIRFASHRYEGYISVVMRKDRRPFYRLFFDRELSNDLKHTFLMSYMRSLEAKLSHEKLSVVEEEIPFWEFLDIEFDQVRIQFRFVAYYIQKPSLPHLFKRLIGAPALKVVGDEIEGKEKNRIHKQGWRRREDLTYELGAKNVVYTLIDTKNKLVYIGEAEDLVKRLNQPHPSIESWDYFRYNVLPLSLTSFRVTIERMVIFDFAQILYNKRGLEFQDISDYSLANDKVDSN